MRRHCASAFAQLRSAANPTRRAPTARQNLSLEGWSTIGEDGRPQPSLAESWTVADDGLSLTVQLRPNVKFHDGTPVDAPTVRDRSRQSLPQIHGPGVRRRRRDQRAGVDREIEISFKRPVAVPARSARSSDSETRRIRSSAQARSSVDGADGSDRTARQSTATTSGKPAIDRIVVKPYPIVRAAWANAARQHRHAVRSRDRCARFADEPSSNVSVFTYHAPLLSTSSCFNRQTPDTCESPTIRRRLNAAIDRDALVQDALNGHGVPSIGPGLAAALGLRDRICRHSLRSTSRCERSRPRSHATPLHLPRPPIRSTSGSRS